MQTWSLNISCKISDVYKNFYQQFLCTLVQMTLEYRVSVPTRCFISWLTLIGLCCTHEETVAHVFLHCPLRNRCFVEIMPRFWYTSDQIQTMRCSKRRKNILFSCFNIRSYHKSSQKGTWVLELELILQLRIFYAINRAWDDKHLL